MGKKEQAEIRQILIDEIEADIVGPRRGPNEASKLNPKTEYLAGVLYPLSIELDAEESIKESNGSEDDEVESKIPSNNLFKPSSFGLTCRLPQNVKSLIAHIEYGTYKSKNEDDGSKIYQRTPQHEKFNINMEKKEDEIEFTSQPKFKIRYNVIQKSNDNILDVYVVNKSENRQKNFSHDIMFQPRITLKSADGKPIFMSGTWKHENEMKRDTHFDLLFHKKTSFGKGHLCAVTWDDKDVKDKMSSKIWTTFIPTESVKAIIPTEETLKCTSMHDMGNCPDKPTLKKMLQEIIPLYSNWIRDVEEKIPEEIDQEYGDETRAAIKKCKNAAKRIQNGINAITNDDDAFEAFKFANMAIAWQQTMTKWAKSNASKGSVDGHEPLKPDKSIRWRLFQIAFILLNVESLINTRSEDRETVDLLWFPTGGGKTEAYLGLATFLIAYRRLRGKEDGQLTSMSLGTAVIMRYTLRLLTVQQFQRAAALMCACEKIRRSDKDMWGEEPFQVGLWVGGNVTPNKREEGEHSAQQQKLSISESDLANIHSNNPYILINCPWCGKKLGKSNGEVGGRPKQWRLYCGRNQCMFSKHLDAGEDLSLPAVLVDEDVYSRCPSLIISTVDKFAQIAWKPECSSIFGRVEKYCQFCGFYNPRTTKIEHAHPGMKTNGKSCKMDVKVLPPELIIQDELHLISGPLGSMVGMYETAIEHLCMDDGVRPKIIASTATTKDAPDQIRGLFNRDNTDIFPPQVIEFGNAFFSEMSMDQDKNKVYLGVLGTGRSSMNVMTRVSAVIVRRIRELAEHAKYGAEDLDPYFTLVTYFNSQKELGGASMSFKDSLPELITRIQRIFDGQSDPKSRILKRQFYELATEELTSRKSSGEIPEILKKLENRWGDESEEAIDLLLATNMLSVGVDISRLGTMIVAGQPKNNSEYIQATGRIGRNNPGLIVTVYSYTKPRDLSHYENFKMYHSALFKNVESVSITPFTPRTRDIAMFGVLVGMIRMKFPGLSLNDDAGKFDQKKSEHSTLVEEIKQVFEDRVLMVDKPEHENTMHDFDKLIKKWIYYVRIHDKRMIKYANYYYQKTRKSLKESHYYLLKTDPSSTKELIPTPRSLRNAEQEQLLFYVDTNTEGEGR